MSRAVLGLLLCATAAHAQRPVSAIPPIPDPLEFEEGTHRWQHRLLYIFAPSDTTTAVEQTLQRVARVWRGIQERDLQLLLLPTPQTAIWLDEGVLVEDVVPRLRARYEVDPEAHMAVLIGKDGTEKARYPLPLDLEAVFARIDAMPMREQELREQDRDG